MSLHNPAFRMYEELDEIKPPRAAPVFQNQWPPPYDEIESQYPVEMPTTGLSGHELNAAQPAVPPKRKASRSESNPPPPSYVLTSRLRSKTDINPVPPIPKTRRPSDIAAFGLSEDTSPPPLPTTRRPSEIAIHDANIPRQPMYVSNKSHGSGDSGTNTSLKKRSSEDGPPPLVPRTRRPSEGNPSKLRPDVFGQGNPVYSNVHPAISEAGEGTNHFIDDDNDVDAEVYVKCVRPDKIPQT